MRESIAGSWRGWSAYSRDRPKRGFANVGCRHANSFAWRGERVSFRAIGLDPDAPFDSPEQDAAATAEQTGRVRSIRAGEPVRRFSRRNLCHGCRRGNPWREPACGGVVWSHAGGADRPTDREPGSGALSSTHPSHRENYNAHPSARQMGAAMNLFGLRKDGTEFPVDIMLKPLETPAGPVGAELCARCHRAA